LKEQEKKPLIIIGAGGHAKMISNILTESGEKILGYVDPNMEAGSNFFGSVILGSDSSIYDYHKDEIFLVNGIGALPNDKLRWNLASKMQLKGYKFLSVIHPSSIIASNVVLGEGVQVMAGAILQTGVKVGNNSIINTGAIVDHDSFVAENCHLAPGVVCSGGVIINKKSYIGAGASIIQNIIIGENVVIASGSNIYKNVPKNVTLIQTTEEKLKEN